LPGFDFLTQRWTEFTFAAGEVVAAHRASTAASASAAESRRRGLIRGRGAIGTLAADLEGRDRSL
jgi:hypothetical protein